MRKARTSIRAFLFQLVMAQLDPAISCRGRNEVDSAINSVDARLSLAALLIQSGDRVGAELEIGTALAIARKIDSPRLIRRCAELGALLAA